MRNRVCWVRLSVVGLILGFQFSAYGILRAQESAFVARQQKLAILPGKVKSVSMVDGELYCYVSGVLLKAQRSGEQIVGFWADTMFVRYGEGVDYVVRHPKTGDIYYTRRDKKGRSFLYCVPKLSESGKSSQVRIGSSGLFGKGMEVEHPTFSTDGSIMIFSSMDGRRGNGGYDLWYSLYDGKGWGKPENMGKRINTSSDECSPVIYRDCLLFTSNGNKEDNGRMAIYSTRLISDRVVGDTVGMLQIGRCRIQRLPEPLNEMQADDYDIAIDTVAGFCYWLSTRPANDTDSQMFSFSGALDGVLLWGLVTDKYKRALVGVQVTARQGNEVVCNTYTDGDGYYKMYLQSDQYYDLAYQLDNYFVAFEEVNTTKSSDEYLISEARQDVVLDYMPIGERIFYNDLYGPNVDVELSEGGKEMLEPLVRFLNDNPVSELEMTLVNDLTSDRVFNGLLTGQRIQTLEGYLYPQLPATVKITIRNGCSGSDGCDAASGVSRLTVLINK